MEIKIKKAFTLTPQNKHLSRVTKQVIANKDRHEVCDKLTTCTNHMLTRPKMIPRASLEFIHQSIKIFKCHSSTVSH